MKSRFLLVLLVSPFACNAPIEGATLSSSEEPLLAEDAGSATAIVRDLAALRSLSGSSRPSSANCNDGTGSSASNCCVLVSGFANHSDGGGGLFCYKPGSGANVVDNGGTIVKPNGLADTANGRWYRSYDGDVDAAWFGANGGDAVDDTDAISRALSVVSSGGGTLYIGRGTYFVRGPGINVVADHVRIRGAGAGTVLKVFAGLDGGLGSNVPLIHFSASHGGVEDLTLDCNSMTESTALRVTPQDETSLSPRVDQTFNVFRNIKITGSCTYGLVMQAGPAVGGAASGCWYNSFSDFDINQATRGIWLKDPPNSGASGCNSNQFSSIVVRSIGLSSSRLAVGIGVDAGSGNSFHGCSIQDATTVGIKIVKNSVTGGADNNDNSFFGTTFENNTLDVDNANAYTQMFGHDMHNLTESTPAKMMSLVGNSRWSRFPGYEYSDVDAIARLNALNGVSISGATLISKRLTLNAGLTVTDGAFWRPDNQGVALVLSNDANRYYHSLHDFQNAPGNRSLMQVVDTMSDGETSILVQRNVGGAFSLQRVSVGAADSGGTGYRALRVPN